MDTPPTVLLLVIQASKCNEPLTPLRGPLLLTVQWWSNLAERLSSPLCHTVGRHRCILESTHGGITNGFHWQWNAPPAGCWWVTTTQVLHGTDRQFLGWVLCQEPVGQCVARPIPLRSRGGIQGSHQGWPCRPLECFKHWPCEQTSTYYSIKPDIFA